ncbi:MAG: HAD family hydrolase [Lysinibacillus sp.]
MCYHTILFDLDGTLTDPKEGIVKSIQFALNHLKIDSPDEQTLASYIGPPLHETFRELGLNEAQTVEAITLYRQRFTTIGMYENEVYEGVEQMLQILREQGKQLAIATSKPLPFATEILRHFKLAQYFDVIAGSNLDGTNSLKADVIATALRQFDQPTPAVMIGDRKHDIIGAKAHHLDSIGVTFGYGSEEELLQAGATSIVHSVQQLQDELVLKEY